MNETKHALDVIDACRRVAFRRIAQGLSMGMVMLCASRLEAAPIRLVPPGQKAATPGLRSVNDFDWRSLRAGDVVELTDGVYEGDVTLRAQGSPTQPVILRAAPGQRPVIKGSLTLEGASWLQVEGMNFVDASGIAVALRGGAHHVTVRNNVVERGGLGIWIGGDAGGSHLIEGNTVRGHRTHGIAIDRVNLPEGTNTVIRDNKVSGNGHHGIEINGSRYVVEFNEVFGNGAALPGTSGIHCYAKNEREATGCFNVIRYNTAWGQRDNAGPDGNGIQLDRWCDHNEVIGNLAFDNDGAGINIFHAAHNRVQGNTCHRNMKDAQRSHPMRLKGELVITNDVDMRARVSDTRVEDNLVVARHPTVSPLVLDGESTRGVELFSNRLFHEAGGALLRIHERTEMRIDDVERSITVARGNRAEAPAFAGQAPRSRQEFGLPAAAR